MFLFFPLIVLVVLVFSCFFCPCSTSCASIDSAAMMECLVVSEDGPIPRAVTVTVTVTLPLYFLE